eukprot:jgi/Botrbrau1/19991/Bobra.200_1s0001.1
MAMDCSLLSGCQRHGQAFHQSRLSCHGHLQRRGLSPLRSRNPAYVVANSLLERRPRSKRRLDFSLFSSSYALEIRSRRLRPICSAASEGLLAAELDPEERGPSWHLPTQIAIAFAVSLCWYWISRSNSATPFLSISAAVSGISKEGMRVTVRSAWAGLTAGCLHTLSGPDHLAALTPLTIGRSHIRASLLGALWGFGHSIGQLLLGLAVLILKERFQHIVPALTKYGSTTVGLTLLAIGIMGLKETFLEHSGEVQIAGVAPSGDAVAVPHQHGHGGHGPAADKEGMGAWTLATGIVYGLQPDALFVIVPALALPTRLAAAAYILMFVFGTVAAMGSYTAVIGATTRKLSSTNAWLTTRLSAIASTVALLIGTGVLLSSWGINVPLLPPLACTLKPCWSCSSRSREATVLFGCASWCQALVVVMGNRLASAAPISLLFFPHCFNFLPAGSGGERPVLPLIRPREGSKMCGGSGLKTPGMQLSSQYLWRRLPMFVGQLESNGILCFAFGVSGCLLSPRSSCGPSGRGDVV